MPPSRGRRSAACARAGASADRRSRAAPFQRTRAQAIDHGQTLLRWMVQMPRALSTSNEIHIGELCSLCSTFASGFSWSLQRPDSCERLILRDGGQRNAEVEGQPVALRPRGRGKSVQCRPPCGPEFAALGFECEPELEVFNLLGTARPSTSWNASHRSWDVIPGNAIPGCIYPATAGCSQDRGSNALDAWFAS